MNKNLLDLSHKLDPLTLALFESLARACQELQLAFFVMGATARDILLTYVYGLEPKRATADVDFAVQVEDWKAYEKLKDLLLESDLFHSTKSPQRLIFQKTLPVDMVPFGALENKHHEITWPPDHEVKMSLLGFEEAYQDAQRIRVRKNPELVIPFATPLGLTIMKLISWNDGAFERKAKDAYDLAFLLRSYMEAGNIDRLQTDHADLMAEKDFDWTYAGARMLGRDIKKIAKPKTQEKILSILAEQTGDKEIYPLVEAMIKNPSPFSNPFEEYLKLLTELKKGMEE